MQTTMLEGKDIAYIQLRVTPYGLTPRTKKKETESDIFMAAEGVDTPDTTVHLGVVRNTNGRAYIDGKISPGRKTAYSLTGAGLHGVVGLRRPWVDTSGLSL